ncbi:hypothetical protein RQP46_003822 [Phenoliferia psychrophenolica]
MSKRGAERQLTDRDRDGDDDDEGGETGAFAAAAPEVVATRKIRALPSRKTAAPPAEAPKNAFGGGSSAGAFGGFGSAVASPNPFGAPPPPAPASASSTSSSGTPSPFSSFSFGAGSAPAAAAIPSLFSFPSASKGASEPSNTFPGQPSFSFPTTKTSSTGPPVLTYYMSLRSLNLTYLDALKAQVDQDPFFNLTEPGSVRTKLDERYRAHWSDIEAALEAAKGGKAVPSASASATPVPSISIDAPAPTPPVPTFSVTPSEPTPASPAPFVPIPFNWAAATGSAAPPAAPAVVKPAAPAFSLPAPPAAFTWGDKPVVAPSGATPPVAGGFVLKPIEKDPYADKSAFTFPPSVAVPTPVAEKEKVSEAPAKPTAIPPSTKLANAPAAPSPLRQATSVSSPAEPTPAPTFSFGSSFGAIAKGTTDAPSVSVPAPAPAPLKTTSSFGGFGTPISSTPYPFASSTSFGFGAASTSSSTSTPTQPKPFSKPLNSPPITTSFGSGASPPSFGFGAALASKPPTAIPSAAGFSFGAAPTSSVPAKVTTGFSFGAASAAPPAPLASTGFNFGAATTKTAPPPAASAGFGFGATPATVASPAPASTGFGFGSSSTAASTASSVADDSTTDVAPADGESQQSEPSGLLGKGEGEEGESVLHELRAKVYKLVDGAWLDTGVAIVAIKQNDEDGKKRVLGRNVVTGKVTINFRLQPTLKVNHDKTVITFLGAEDGTPASFRLKIKTIENAAAMKAKLEEHAGSAYFELFDGRRSQPNPAPNAVTSPTRTSEKNADLERKVRLFGVVNALREGRYPSNQQIEHTLDYVLNNSPIETKKLSKDGKTLIEDFQNIIKTAKSIVEEKNADELLQNFLYHSRTVDTGKAKVNVNAPVGKDDLKADGDQAIEHLRTLGKLIFTNSEARKLLKDIGILGRDVAADAAIKVGQTARPSEHELNKVDEPAPSNQWVGPDGEIRSHNDAVPDTGLAAKRDAAKQTAADLQSQAQQQAQETGNRVANAADQGQQGQYATDEDRAAAAANAGGDQAKEEAANLVQRMKAKIPDEHKDKAREQAHKLKEYGQDKFPQERRDRFIYRLKKVVVENQRHRDYQEAIEFFLDRAETYQSHAQDISKQGQDQVNIHEDGSFQQAQFELRTLLERFADNTSMQPIIDAVNQLYTDAKNDDELRAWFSQLNGYLRKVLQEPGYIMKDASDQEGRRLMDLGKRFWDPETGKYAAHKDALFDTTAAFFKSYADDELNVQLGEDVKKLTKDLLMDGDGNLKYKSHLWADVREVILPALGKNIGYIPIPRIEYTDGQIDLVVENLTLESQNLLPNVFEFEARNYFKVSPYDAIKDQSKHSFWVSFSQVQCDLKDVAFYIKKKTGFPKVQDSGVADVFIGGKGISGKIHLESTGRSDRAFNIVDVKVKIDKFKFAVRENKHAFLLATFKPLLSGLIKKAVATGIQEGIRSGLVQIDAQLADLAERYQDAKSADGVKTLDAVKTSYREKKAEAERTAEKAKAKAPDGKFAISAQPSDQLVDWQSKNSVVRKVGEQQALANKSSHDWHSPAFDIVGKKSSPPAKTDVTPVPSPTTPHGNSQVSGATPGGYSTTPVSSGAAGAIAPNNLPAHQNLAGQHSLPSHQIEHGSEGLVGTPIADTFAHSSATPGHSGLASGTGSSALRPPPGSRGTRGLVHRVICTCSYVDRSVLSLRLWH